MSIPRFGSRQPAGPISELIFDSPGGALCLLLDDLAGAGDVGGAA